MTGLIHFYGYNYYGIKKNIYCAEITLKRDRDHKYIFFKPIKTIHMHNNSDHINNEKG